MVSLDHIRRSLGAAWRLFLHDEDGMEAFDTSYEGFWASFWTIALTAPLYLFTLLLEPMVLAAAGPDAPAPPASQATFLVSELTGYVLSWIAFPVVMIYITKLLRLGQRYVPLIVAYNWTVMLLSLIALPPHILFALGLISLESLVILSVVVFTLSIYVRWLVVRIALFTSGVTAFGIVALDILTGLLILNLMDRLHSPV